MAKPFSAKENAESAWDDLVVSILAVNHYSLERTYALLSGLRGQGLTNPSALADGDVDDIERRLRTSGYDRGPFMTRLFAQRLAALGDLIRAKGAPECEQALGGNNRAAIKELLLPVKGIGSVVLGNFFILREV